MRNLVTSLVAVATVAGLAGTASAGGSPNTLGVGAELMFSNSAADDVGGVSANYDFGDFHLGGFLGIADPAGANNTRLELGMRFYYHLHSSAMSDFGVGGALAYANTPINNSDEKNDEVYLVPGFQIRAFVASNVALSFTAGIALGLGDADGVALDGQATGAAGIHYYFF